MKTQTQQAIEAILEVTGHTEGDLTLSKVDRDQVVETLFSNYQEGQYNIKSEKATTDEASVKKYISSQVSDVLKKQPLFNDGVEYSPNKTGSRNPKIKAVKQAIALFTTQNNTEALKVANTELERLQAEANASKKPEINLDHLPEAVRKLM